MKKIIFFISLFLWVSVSAQTVLPEKCLTFYPDDLQSSSVLSEATVRKLAASKLFGQAMTVREKRFWIVFSDRDNNMTYTKPGGRDTHSVLHFNERLRIADISEGYALVYSEPQEDIAYPKISQYAKCKGWISLQHLLLWHSCPANEAGIYNKALLCVNLDERADSDLGRLFYNPDDKSDYEVLETDMNFYYVMKREGNLVLLSKTHTLDGRSDQMLFGWVAEQSYVAWNQRSCLEPTWEKEDVRFFADNGVQADICKGQDMKQRATSVNFRYREAPQHDRYFFRMHPDFLRFPLLDNGTESLYNCSAFVTAGGKSFVINNDDSSALSYSEDKQRELTNINIGIVIDGTTSMNKFYEAVETAIKEGVKFFGKQYKVKVGIVIYRDYADGDHVKEVFPLTNPKNEKLYSFLENGGEYGVKSDRRDKTLEEAMYLGIDTALEKLGFRKDQSNILLVVGDCGNSRDDSKISSESLVSKLVAKNVHIMGFQVNRKSHDAYELFNSQLLEMMRRSIEVKYTTLHEGIKVRIKETQDGYTLINDVKSNFYIGEHNFPEYGHEVEVPKLASMIQEAIMSCSESVNHQLNVLADFNAGGGFKKNRNVVNTDLDVDELWLKHTLGDKYDMIKNSNSLLAFQGYVRKTHQSGRKYFKPVVFISSDELNLLLDRLEPVNDAAVAMSNDRKPYIDALKSLVQVMAPEGYTDDVISKMNVKQVMARISGLNEAASALKGRTIQEIASPRAVTAAEYAKLVEEFKRKYEGLRRLKSQPYKYTRTFNGLKYYWLPIEMLP